LPGSEVLDMTPDRAAVRAIFAAPRAAGRRELFEDEALAVLAAYGIPVLPPKLCASATEAAAAAVALGPPVALKARALLRHKPRWGGVVLNLRHFDTVRLAADTMAEEVARRAPGAVFDGFLVQAWRRAG
jgi:acetyltransferase